MSDKDFNDNVLPVVVMPRTTWTWSCRQCCCYHEDNINVPMMSCNTGTKIMPSVDDTPLLLTV